MSNELIIKKSWWNKNWKWFIPLSAFLIVAFIIIISGINGLNDFTQTYANQSLCQNAINEANKNAKVLEIIGEIEPIDNLAIMEGDSFFSNENKTANITVRVNGKRRKGKMDIVADKIADKWEYKWIKIRVKNPDDVIEVVKPNVPKIEFDGNKFELPIKVNSAKEKLSLQYEYYVGFYRGNVNDQSIVTQLEDYPMFMGSDNDNEKSYYDNYFVGITFFKNDKTIEQFKNEFEKQYHKKFITEIVDFGMTKTPLKTTYYYIKTDDGTFIALKEIHRKFANKKYISISFYNGISESQLGKYLEYVN